MSIVLDILPGIKFVSLPKVYAHFWCMIFLRSAIHSIPARRGKPVREAEIAGMIRQIAEIDRAC